MLAERRQRGQGIIEAVVGIFVIILVLYLLIDFAALYLAKLVNDEACRNACRAAAIADPSSQDEWRRRAIGALSRIAGGGYIVKGPELVASQSGPLTGSPPLMRIVTRVEMKVPGPLPFLPEKAVLTAMEQYPLTFVSAADRAIARN